jgi:hypothetical protein
MRAAVRRATTLILRAEDELEEAGSVIANGFLRLDHDEWIRVTEKRSAALAGVSPDASPRRPEAGSTGRRERPLGHPHPRTKWHSPTLRDPCCQVPFRLRA